MSDIEVPKPTRVASEVLSAIRSGCSSSSCHIKPKNTPTREACHCVFEIVEVLVGPDGPYRSIEKFEEKLKELQQDVDRMEDKVWDADNARNAAEDDLEEMATEVDTLKDEITGLTQDLDAAHMTIEGQVEEIDRLRDDIEDLQDELRERLSREEFD